MYITYYKLLQAYKKEKNIHKKQRLHAICIIKINKYTISETAKQMFCTYQCVKNWFNQFERYGLDGLEDSPRSGRPPLISCKKLQKIEQAFKKISGGMTPKKLMRFIFERTHVTYHISHVCRLMHKWNLKAKVPQKVHVRAASNNACRNWRNRIILRIEKAKKKGFTIFIQDESVFVDDVRLGKKYWVDANQRMIVQWRGSHQRFLVYGMMTDDNQSFFRSYEKFNAIAFMDYLEAARKKFGKIFVIIDRAPQHKARDVKKYLRKNKDVKLAYLPKGSPHLSMIEEIWRQCKHVNVESEFYESIQEMRYVVMEYFRTHRFNLDMYQYFVRTIN